MSQHETLTDESDWRQEWRWGDRSLAVMLLNGTGRETLLKRAKNNHSLAESLTHKVRIYAISDVSEVWSQTTNWDKQVSGAPVGDASCETKSCSGTPGLWGSGARGQEASSGAPSPHTLTPPPLEVFIQTQLSWAVWSAEGEKNQPERKSSSRSCVICYRSNLWLWQCKQQHQRSWVYLAKQILSIMRTFFFQITAINAFTHQMCVFSPLQDIFSKLITECLQMEHEPHAAPPTQSLYFFDGSLFSLLSFFTSISHSNKTNNSSWQACYRRISAPRALSDKRDANCKDNNLSGNMRQSGNQPGFSGFCSGILFSETTLISIQNCPITSFTQIFVFSVTVVNLVTNPSFIHSYFKIKPNPKKQNNDLLHFHTFSRLKWTKRINWNIQIGQSPITIPFFPFYN